MLDKSVEAQSKNTILEAAKETKESKEFDVVKKSAKQSHNTQNTERGRKHPKTNTNIVAPHTNKDVQSVTRTVSEAAVQIILNECADAWAEEWQQKDSKVHDMNQDSEETEVSTEELYVVTSKVFNLHSIWAIIYC